jgi:S-DNA-T family DNA segregation ATPase FtsK/SpoIIIE
MSDRPADSRVRRDGRRDLTAGGLVVLAVFLGVALWSFDKADPPTDLVYPVHASARNACGPVGAAVAFPLVEILGLTAFSAVGLMLLAAAAVALELPVRIVFRQGVGAILLTLVSAVLLDRFDVADRYQTFAGPGGTLGSASRRLLESHLSVGGGILAVVALGGAGLVLTFGSYVYLATFAVGGLADRGARGCVRGLTAGLRRLRRTKPTLGSEMEDAAVDEEEAVADDEASDTVDEAENNEDEEVDDEEEEEDVGPRIIRTGIDKGPLPLASMTARSADVTLPSLEILDDIEPFEMLEHDEEIRERARLLEKTFAEFDMKVRVVQIDTGPVVTQYEIELEPGLRARKVMALSDDIAIALKASSVRIVAPIPGKNTVGIEVPNARRAKVGLKEVMVKSAGAAAGMRLPMYLGKDVKGQPMVHDLATMPHLLIAGRTGTGKSVCLNTLILSILMTKTPDQVKMLMIDPKMVELSLYKSIPHLMHPVVTDMKKAEAILAWAVEKMEERYSILASVGVRHIDSYNALSFDEICQRLELGEDESRDRIPRHMPYILIFADEMADLMMTSAKEVEAHIIRLAQKSRAVGIHLVLATQKPTVDVVTGLIKSNLPARIAFQVASRTDSRVVLDEMGADKLLGNGDMLFLYPGTSKITRAQGTYVSDHEVTRIVDYLSKQARPQFSEELLKMAVGPKNEEGAASPLPQRDEMYEAAVEVVVREQRGSVSLIQRALGLGYGRAARLIDYMAEDGIVGEYNGSQAREVLVQPDQWDEFRRQKFAKAG